MTDPKRDPRIEAKVLPTLGLRCTVLGLSPRPIPHITQRCLQIVGDYNRAA
jgi:hypothetical protein